MRYPAVKLDGHGVVLVQQVAVLVAAIAPSSCLPLRAGQAVRAFDVPHIAILEHRVNAGRIRAQQLG
jgi:hypothetical protein